jgi:sugar phosphate isomerase/epimerase
VKTRNKLYIAAEKVAGDDEFERHLEIAKQRDLGIEIQEFSVPEVMRGNWKKRLDEYKRLLRDFQGDLSIHNAFFNLVNVARDPDVLELTRKKYDFHFMIAKELGCKIIVSHFAWHPFIRDIWLYQWQEAQVKFWEHYVNIAEKEDFLLVCENILEPRPEILKPIIDKLDSPRFKFIFDVGHANIISEVPIEDWIMTFGRDLVYMHVSNNYRNYDAHDSVLKGTVNYDYVFKELDRVGIAPIITTEIYGEALLESIDYLEAKIKTTDVYQRPAPPSSPQ